MYLFFQFLPFSFIKSATKVQKNFDICKKKCIFAPKIVKSLFVGDQSLLRSWHRWREIVHLEEQRDMYRQGAEKAQQEMLQLQNPDSLEQYAREHYYMHTPNEDIFLVEDD